MNQNTTYTHQRRGTLRSYIPAVSGQKGGQQKTKRPLGESLKNDQKIQKFLLELMYKNKRGQIKRLTTHTTSAKRKSNQIMKKLWFRPNFQTKRKG